MSSLPTLTFKDQVYQLPARDSLLDAAAAGRKDLRPAKQVSELMRNYALALPNFVEKLAQQDLDRGAHEKKESSSYRKFFEDDELEVYYQIHVQKPEEFKYTLAASNKLNGAWERFTSINSSNGDLQSADWNINGNLFEQLQLHKDRDSDFQAKFIDPGAQDIGRISTKYLFNDHKNGTLRLHNVMVSQANRLIELHRRYGINGTGVRIGKWLFMSRKMDKLGYGREYILTKRSEDKYDDDSRAAFVVKTNSSGTIQEIMQVSSRAGQSYKLYRGDNCAEIDQEAQLRIIDKLQQSKVAQDIILLLGDPNVPGDNGLQSLFIGTDEGRKLCEAAAARLDKAFLDSETVHKIKLEKPGFDIKLAGENLLSEQNVSRLREELGILINKETHDKCRLDPNLVKYAKLEKNQVSLAFYDSDYGPGFKKTKVFDEDGKEVLFHAYGPSRLRDLSNPNNRVLPETELEEFLKKLGLKLTSDEQDKAILRWHLMRPENIKALAEIGYILDPQTETVHLLAPAGKPLLRKTKIASLVDLSTKRSLFSYPANMFIGKFKKATPGVYDSDTNLLSIPRDFNKLLEYIGFKIGSPTETEAYVQVELNSTSDRKETMESIIGQRREQMKNYYVRDLSFSLALVELKDRGYSNFGIVESVDAKPMFISALKDGQNYLIRISTQNSNMKKQIEPLMQTVEYDQVPAILKLHKMDQEKRLPGEVVFEILENEKV